MSFKEQAAASKPGTAQGDEASALPDLDTAPSAALKARHEKSTAVGEPITDDPTLTHPTGSLAEDDSSQEPSALVEYALLDYLVRPQQERLGDGQTQSLGGLEVDHKLELGGLLDGEVARLGALQNLAYKDGRAPVHVRQTRSVSHDTACLCKLSETR